MELLETLVGTGFNLASTAVTWMTANPITLVGVGLGATGAAIGLVKKAMRIGGRRR